MTPELGRSENSYQDQFDNAVNNKFSQLPNWLTDIKKEAMNTFVKRGYPTITDEDWKYTNISEIAQQSFSIKPIVVATREEELPSYIKTTGIRLTFINGIFSPENSSRRNLPKGVIVCNLSEAFQNHGDLLSNYWLKNSYFKENSFVAFNTAFVSDGVFIFIPKGVAVEEPIHLFFIANTDKSHQVFHPRIFVLANNGSMTTIAEHYLSLTNNIYLTNAVTEIFSEDNASIEYYKTQDENTNSFHIANTNIDLHRGSVFTNSAIALGGKLSRNQLQVKFNAPGGECYLNGLYHINGNQLADSHIRIQHEHEHCTSQLLYKGIVDGKARGVFNGKVFVHKGAQKSNATQTNKNLLLSADARVDTKPDLEIFADDVKCSHGATVGQLSNEELFYLLSRGLSLRAAKNLLTYGFAQEIIEKIKIGFIKRNIDEALATRCTL